MRRFRLLLATLSRRACLTVAAVCFLFGSALSAAAQPTTITDPLGLGETLSFQVFHNGTPVSDPTVVTPFLGEPASTQPLATVPEPSTLLLMLTGAGLVLAARRWL